MPYRLAESIAVIPAHVYLAHTKGQGRSFHLKHLGLEFHVLRDCLVVGHESQAITPAPLSGRVTYVFTESCPYVSNEHILPKILEDNLDKPEMALVEAVPLFPPGAFNFWHWTFESLPKLLALESAGYTGSYIIPAAALENPDSVIMQSLALFDFPLERLLPSGPVYKIKSMILPQRLSGFSLADNMALTEFLREKLLNAVGRLDGSRRLYVRRVARRKITNEDDILAVLDDFGFEIMTPEDISQKEQWQAMTAVDCSVMVHGANSTLTLLQKPGSGAIELFGNRYISYNNLHSARLLRLRYYPLVEDLEPSSYFSEQTPVVNFLLQGMNADILTDPLHLRIALESILNA